MNILISGYSNYIIKDLVSFFSQDKKKTIIATYKSKKPGLKKKNIIFKKLDLKKKICKIKGVNILIHGASATPLKNYSKKDYKKINILGFKNILKAICDKDLSHVVLFSTVSVYGNPKSIIRRPINENNPLLPNNEYAKTKVSMEKILTQFCKKKKICGLTLRFPGVLGRRRNKNNFLSNVIRSIKEKKSFKVYGPDNMFNNMIGTEDISKIILKFFKTKKKKNMIFNCAVSEKRKILKIIYIIEDLVGKKAKFKLINSSYNSFVINNSKLIKNGYKVSSIKTTLKKII